MVFAPGLGAFIVVRRLVWAERESLIPLDVLLLSASGTPVASWTCGWGWLPVFNLFLCFFLPYLPNPCGSKHVAMFCMS